MIILKNFFKKTVESGGHIIYCSIENQLNFKNHYRQQLLWLPVFLLSTISINSQKFHNDYAIAA